MLLFPGNVHGTDCEGCLFLTDLRADHGSSEDDSEAVVVKVGTAVLFLISTPNIFHLYSSTAVHLLTCSMLLLASFATIIHLFHRSDRRTLRLRHEPGTIASAVSIGAQTGMGDLLAGRQNTKDISEALQDRKFRIDPETMKIIMEGEDGYEYASSPMERRRSIFAALQGQKRESRFLRPPGSPNLATSGMAM